MPVLYLAMLVGAEPASQPTSEQGLAELPALEGIAAIDRAASQPASPSRAGDTLREWLTGNVRLTGAFLHASDRHLMPADDGLLLVAARGLVSHSIGEHFGVELNYFADFSRRPQASTGGAFASAGSTVSPYRTRYLQWEFWNSGSIAATTGIDRLALRFHSGFFSLSIGRQAVNYSVTGFFTPNDFFAPFTATSVNRVYKPGVDALTLGFSLGMLTSLEIVGVLGSDTQGRPQWGRSGLLASLRTSVGGFELSALGGKVAERWVVGGSAQGDLGPVGIRAEGHVGIPDEDGRGRRGGDMDRPIHGRFAVGPNINLNWHALTFSLQYAFISDGTLTPSEYLPRALRLYPDDLPYLGCHYIGAVAGLQIVPILHANLITFVNAGDGSSTVGLGFLYNAANEVDFIGGIYAPLGKRVSVGPAGDVTLGSELGSGPFAAYFETRISF